MTEANCSTFYKYAYLSDPSFMRYLCDDMHDLQDGKAVWERNVSSSDTTTELGELMVTLEEMAHAVRVSITSSSSSRCSAIHLFRCHPMWACVLATHLLQVQEDEDIDEEAEALAAKARQDAEAARLAAEKGRASENGVATAVTTDEEGYVSNGRY